MAWARTGFDHLITTQSSSFQNAWHINKKIEPGLYMYISFFWLIYIYHLLCSLTVTTPPWYRWAGPNMSVSGIEYMTRYFSIENLEVRFGSTDHTYNRRFFYHGNVLHILSLTSHNGDIYILFGPILSKAQTKIRAEPNEDESPGNP